MGYNNKKYDFLSRTLIMLSHTLVVLKYTRSIDNITVKYSFALIAIEAENIFDDLTETVYEMPFNFDWSYNN